MNNTSTLTAILIAASVSNASLAEKNTDAGGWYLLPQLSAYKFDSDRDIDDDLGLGLGAGYQFNSHWATELNYANASTETDGGEDVDFDYWHLDGLYFFSSIDRLQPYLVAGIGDAAFEFNQTHNETLLSAGAGLQYQLSERFSLRSDLRALHSLDQELTDVALNVGLRFMLGGGSDKKTAAPATSLVVVAQDHDNDGVNDSQDNCPNTPANISVKEDGCMLDSDNDGVADNNDSCPGTALNSGDVDQRGCLLDSDADGVTDAEDACPNTSGGAKVDDKGCYLQLTEIKSFRLNLQFETNKAVLNPDAFADVEQLAAFLTAYPQTSVIIEGHSDSPGAADYNQKLSLSRANAVVDVLIQRFAIDSSRLNAKGYGESKPIASNNTAEGRNQNRRVVAVVETTVNKTN